MDQSATEPLRYRRLGRYRWHSTFLVPVGVLLVVALSVHTLYRMAQGQSEKKANAEIVRTGIRCDLTDIAMPNAERGGFVLKANCPQGTADVAPSMSLWVRLIEALPSDQRVVKCAVRRDGKYTDCKRTDEFARRGDR